MSLYTNFWTFDTEDDGKGNPIWFVFYNGKKYFHFDNKQSAIRFLKHFIKRYDKSKRIKIFACNMEYDLNNLFGYDLDKIYYVYSNRFIIAKAGKIDFLDTFNHWHFSVAEMGELVNIPKLNRPDNMKNDKKSLEYCKQDCLILYEFVKRMLGVYQGYGMNFIKSTSASQTFNYFNTNFSNFRKKYRFEATKNKKGNTYFKRVNFFPDEVLKEFQSYYYGARTECFLIGKYKNINVVDVNSMYPYVMTFKYPDPYYFRKSKVPNSKFYLIDCLIESNLKYPVIPNRLENGLLAFTNGTFRVKTNSIELEYFIKLGGKVKEIYEVINFPNTLEPFKDYIKFLYPKKQNAKNVFERETVKLLMNSLYGKFAEYKSGYSVYPLEEALRLKKHGERKGNLIIVNDKQEYPIHTNFIFSLFVTAYARIKLINEIILLDNLNYNVLYCDTDSIHYQGKFIHSDNGKIGEFSKQEFYKSVYIKGLKYYKCVPENNKSIFKIKGIKKTNRREFFNTGKTIINRPVKLRESLIQDKLKGKLNVWTDFKKTDERKYNKGIIKDKIIEPYIVDKNGNILNQKGDKHKTYKDYL